MRTVNVFSIVVFAAATIATMMSASSVAQTTTAPSTQSPSASCDLNRKACYAGKTETGINGVRYVPPDVVKECEAAYRMCMSRR